MGVCVHECKCVHLCVGGGRDKKEEEEWKGRTEKEEMEIKVES